MQEPCLVPGHGEGTTLHVSLSWESRAHLSRGKDCKLGAFWLLEVRQGARIGLVGFIAEDAPK